MKRLLTLILFSSLLLYTHYDYVVMGDGDINKLIYYLCNVCGIIFDASIVTLVACAFKRAGARMVAAGIFWAWCMVNVIYLRHFDTYVDITMIGEVRNFDMLGESIVSLTHIRDIVVSILFLGACYWVFFSTMDRWKQLRWYYLFVPIALSFAGIYVTNSRAKHVPLVKAFNFWGGNFGSNSYVVGYRYGFFHFFYSNLYTLNMHRDRTEADIKSMQELSRRRATEAMPANDSTALPRNIVFVLMESIMSDAVTAVCDGDSVMPNLARLAREAQYCNLNMTSEVGIGWSSDGQLIYMSGILQHSTKNTVNTFTHNSHRGMGSICKELGYSTAMVIPTGKHVWHQEEMCVAYGIDSLYSTIKHGHDDDKHLVDSTIQVLNHYKNERLFVTILNISTHTPISQHFPERMRDFNDKSFPEKEILYFERANYFDFHLGRMIEALRRNGQWDNSLVILASDHHDDDWVDKTHNSIPLIITGGFQLPVQQHDKAVIYQTDVYPTLLHLLHVKQDWQGVGRDLFNPKSMRLSPAEKHRISDIILETDWFKK